MTKIYLVRHAEAEGNLYRLVQGHFDGLVTKLGYDQIRGFSQPLLTVNPFVFYQPI